MLVNFPHCAPPNALLHGHVVVGIGRQALERMVSGSGWNFFIVQFFLIYRHMLVNFPHCAPPNALLHGHVVVSIGRQALERRGSGSGWKFFQ
jgi:hypothetical protein